MSARLPGNRWDAAKRQAFIRAWNRGDTMGQLRAKFGMARPDNIAGRLRKAGHDLAYRAPQRGSTAVAAS